MPGCCSSQLPIHMLYTYEGGSNWGAPFLPPPQMEGSLESASRVNRNHGTPMPRKDHELVIVMFGWPWLLDIFTPGTWKTKHCFVGECDCYVMTSHTEITNREWFLETSPVTSPKHVIRVIPRTFPTRASHERSCLVAWLALLLSLSATFSALLWVVNILMTLAKTEKDILKILINQKVQVCLPRNNRIAVFDQVWFCLITICVYNMYTCIQHLYM